MQSQLQSTNEVMGRDESRETVAKNSLLHGRFTVTELEEFLKTPPAGFSVEAFGLDGVRVLSDPEQSLVLIDDFDSCRGRICFHKSLGREVKMQNLWEYTSMRKSLLSKRIYLLMSVCEGSLTETNEKAANDARVLQQYVVSINGSDPYIKWQMERGLDWTISSIAGESYRVDIDLMEVVESWGAKNIQIISDEAIKVKPVWRDACFTLKYYSDALFDFPHWFGFSKRKFNLRLT
ncbi:mesenteric estrogen-dependent adipogenesis protein-like [Cheilinus undulatus]|uniref:mesenteric estrogen-dependent adipogenesis protein-like n=1 Tax=Cheilinus undulatus TaxID=241271 RepID=UPI001BD5FE78|nr:mesenteric estrogen-dependent adipogenesis protein-like [Cheilinus undulatus]